MVFWFIDGEYMRYLQLISILLFCSNAYSAELLICAKDSTFDSGCKVGDILVVRPNGHVWGKEEAPPNYVQVSVPDMTYDEAKHYEESLMMDDGVDTDGNPKQKMKRLRKYYVGVSEVEEAKNNGGKLTRTKTKKQENVKVKTE